MEPFDVNIAKADIQDSLKCQGDRLVRASHNLHFYRHGDIPKTRISGDGYGERRDRRLSWIMRQIVQIATRDLYRTSPTRIVPDDPEATAWLDKVYRCNDVWAKFPEADRLSMVTDVAWFAVAATGNPNDPIRINLYAGDQVVAWESQDEPLKLGALCLISDVAHPGGETQRKYDLWTQDTIYHYESKKDANGSWANLNPPSLVGEEPNPYGVIPFTSVHYEYPTTSLQTTSPGTYLATVNKDVNHRLTRLDELIKNNPPMKTLMGADANFQPPTPFEPSDFLQIPGSKAGTEGVFKYEQANLGFVASEWDDLSRYIEHTLECLGIPPAAYRQIQSSAKSGAALMAEQISLIESAKGRQMPFSCYETDLARLCFQVYAASGGTAFDGADFQLTVKWGDMYPSLPGPERDLADQWQLDNDLQSLIGLLIKRDHMSREEAVLHLEQVAEDKKKEVEILGTLPLPAPVGTDMSAGTTSAPPEAFADLTQQN